MLSKLKSLLSGKPAPYVRQPAIIKIQCTDFDSIEQEVTVSESNLYNEYLVMKCPICIEEFKVSVFQVDNDYTHFDNHAFKVVSGKLLPKSL